MQVGVDTKTGWPLAANIITNKSKKTEQKIKKDGNLNSVFSLLFKWSE